MIKIWKQLSGFWQETLPLHKKIRAFEKEALAIASKPELFIGPPDKAMFWAHTGTMRTTNESLCHIFALSRQSGYYMLRDLEAFKQAEGLIKKYKTQCDDFSYDFADARYYMWDVLSEAYAHAAQGTQIVVAPMMHCMMTGLSEKNCRFWMERKLIKLCA